MAISEYRTAREKKLYSRAGTWRHKNVLRENEVIKTHNKLFTNAHKVGGSGLTRISSIEKKICCFVMYCSTHKLSSANSRGNEIILIQFDIQHNILRWQRMIFAYNLLCDEWTSHGFISADISQLIIMWNIESFEGGVAEERYDKDIRICVLQLWDKLMKIWVFWKILIAIKAPWKLFKDFLTIIFN
jgi:hypothetical protein